MIKIGSIIKINEMFGNIGEVIKMDKTHVILQFENGSKTCFSKAGLEEDVMGNKEIEEEINKCQNYIKYLEKHLDKSIEM